jgi:hypothetical protein
LDLSGRVWFLALLAVDKHVYEFLLIKSDAILIRDGHDTFYLDALYGCEAKDL